MLDLANDSLDFYDNVIAPYKGALEEWYVTNYGTKVYCQLIFLTVVCVLKPRSSLTWRLFPDLPKPPNELTSYFNIK